MVGREHGIFIISVVFRIVEREQGVLTIGVVFSTVHEVGREQGILTISVVFSIAHEVGREQRVLTVVLSRSMYYPSLGFQTCHVRLVISDIIAPPCMVGSGYPGPSLA